MAGIDTIEAADALYDVAERIGGCLGKEFADGAVGRCPHGSVGSFDEGLIQEESGTFAGEDNYELAEVGAEAFQQGLGNRL